MGSTCSSRVETGGTPDTCRRLESARPLKPTEGGGERWKRGGRLEESRAVLLRTLLRPWTSCRRRIDDRAAL